MGTSTTPKYVVDIYTPTEDGRGRTKETVIWNYKTHGTANQANLEKFILVYGKSFDYGGVNFHISQAAGRILFPTRAVLRTNRLAYSEVAEWIAPAFMVW